MVVSTASFIYLLFFSICSILSSIQRFFRGKKKKKLKSGSAFVPAKSIRSLLLVEMSRCKLSYK